MKDRVQELVRANTLLPTSSPQMLSPFALETWDDGVSVPRRNLVFSLIPTASAIVASLLAAPKLSSRTCICQTFV